MTSLWGGMSYLFHHTKTKCKTQNVDDFLQSIYKAKPYFQIFRDTLYSAIVKISLLFYCCTSSIVADPRALRWAVQTHVHG